MTDEIDELQRAEALIDASNRIADAVIYRIMPLLVLPDHARRQLYNEAIAKHGAVLDPFDACRVVDATIEKEIHDRAAAIRFAAQARRSRGRKLRAIRRRFVAQAM